VDDDAPSLSRDELVHGAAQRHDLQAQPGPAADRDFFRLGQPPRASYVFDTRGDAALFGAAGTVRVTHDGGYAAVSGKAVALEPATGFTFDTPLTFRPR
jgi:hypothetical protein